MTWDTARTRRLLIEAGVEEFSAFGLGGARMDRIASRAAVSKERIYKYFGKKEQFFGAVLDHELASAMEAVELEGTGPRAVADYAGRVFDHQRSHPSLPRLMFWEGLERRTTVIEASRHLRSRAKVEGLREAMPELSELAAQELMLTVVTIVDGWAVLPNADELFVTTSDDSTRAAQRREFIVFSVEAIARSLLEGAGAVTPRRT